MAVRQFFVRHWYIVASIVGVISGVIVAACPLVGIDTSPVSSLFKLSLPPLPQGALFGIVAGIYFFIFLKPKPSSERLVVWVLASYISFIAAVMAPLFLKGLIDQNILQKVPDISPGLGGLVGVSILAVTFHYLFLRLDWRSLIALLLVGTLIPIFTTLQSGFSLFILWQTAVMLVFGYQIFTSQKQQSIPTSLQNQT